MIDWPVNLPTLNSRTAGIAVNGGNNASGEDSTHHGSVRSFILRPLQESDIDPIFHACQDPLIPAFTRVPSPYDREMAVDFVRESAFAYLNRLAVSFAIEVDGEFFRILGRETEIINTGGQKVYPAEIESLILGLENIEDVAVFGEKHALLGQIIVAKILLKESEALETVKKRVRNACLRSLAAFKAPSKVFLVENPLINARQKKVRKESIKNYNLKNGLKFKQM